MKGETWINPTDARSAIKCGTGNGVKVAVIDSGIETTHPQLAGLDLSDDLVVTGDGVRLVVRDGRGRDVYGHGTAVAGVLKDVAPDVTIGSFRALDDRNRSRSYLVAECARLAIERGYHIINCSFGCRGLQRYLGDYKEWIDSAYLAGVTVIAAGSNVDDDIPEWPAHFPTVISVASNDCPDLDWTARPEQMVSLAAKGERVSVPWLNGETRIQTGSSFAAPRVAGLIARLLSIYPNIPADLIKPLLLRT